MPSPTSELARSIQTRPTMNWVGVVTAVSADPSGFQWISAQVGDTVVEQIAYPDGYTPTVGDRVWGMRFTGDWIAVGKLSIADEYALSWDIPDEIDEAAGDFTIRIERTGGTLPASVVVSLYDASEPFGGTAEFGVHLVDPGPTTLTWEVGDVTPRTITVTPIAAEDGDHTIVVAMESASGATGADLATITIRDLTTDPTVPRIVFSESADLSFPVPLAGSTISGCVHILAADPVVGGADSLILSADSVEWWYGDGAVPDQTALDALDDTADEWVRDDPHFQGSVDGTPRAWCTAVSAPYNSNETVDTTPGNLPGDTTGHIYTQWSATQIATARSRLASSPWSTYKSVHDANVAAGMATGLLSVTDNGGDGSNLRRWTTDPAYIPGTEIYAGSERYDYVDVGLVLSKVCNALAMAWQLEDDTAAAQKAVDLLYHHLGNPATSLDMTVKANGSLSRNVEIYNTHVGIFRALGLVWAFDQWTSAQKAQIRTALGQYLVTHRPYDDPGGIVDENNIDIWRAASRCNAAAILGDTAAIQEEADWFKSRITRLQRSDGLWAAEQARDRGVFYTVYACAAACMLGLVVDEHTSTNLMNWTSSGRGIRPGLDAMVPYVNTADPAATWEATGRSETEVNGPMSKTTMNLECYEIGWAKWADADYSSIITRWGRPIGNQYSGHGWTFYAGATI